jgi:hypothetical protein
MHYVQADARVKNKTTSSHGLRHHVAGRRQKVQFNSNVGANGRPKVQAKKLSRSGSGKGKGKSKVIVLRGVDIF